MTSPRMGDQAIDKFLDEYENLCRKYRLSLSHEDAYGSFIIEEFSEENIEWVKGATRAAKYL